MNHFEKIFEELFLKKYKETLNLGKVESFNHLYQRCEEETGITQNHLSQVFIKNLNKKYHSITEGCWLYDFLTEGLEELVIHEYRKVEVITIKGRVLKDLALTPNEYQLYLETLAITYTMEWNHNSPFCSFYGEIKKNPVRFSLTHQSLSSQGEAKLFIRFISQTTIDLKNFLINNDSIDIQQLVHSKMNILICGATGSGKTTFLSSIVQLIPGDEHVLILEDTPEIKSSFINWTKLISDERHQGKKMIDLCTYSMRMRPDRIILGEMRSHEVVSFLLALNSGHRGCMSTVHAANAPEALYRLGLLFELYSSKGSMSDKKVMELICRNIDYVFYLENKKIKEIIKVIGFDGDKPFYEEVFNLSG